MSNEIFMTSNQGISQTQRLLDTLMPDYFKIDSRDIPELISYIHKISAQFNYYNAQTNEKDGTWEDFLYNDSYLATLLISRIDVVDISSQFSIIKKTIEYDSNSILLSERLDKLTKLIDFLYDVITQLSKLQRLLNALPLPNNLGEVLVNIQSTNEELAQLKNYCEEASLVFISFKNPDPSPKLSGNKKKEDVGLPMLLESSNKEKINGSIRFLTTLFESIIAKFNNLVRTSKSYISRNTLLEAQFLPQIGLLIGFLDLYKSAQEKINDFNRRHLEYYYKDVLELKPKKGHPDELNIIIEPEIGIKQLEIKPSQLLITDIPNEEHPIIYELNNPITLSAAAIVEIKTIFVSQFAQVASKNIEIDNIIENQVYQAAPKVFSVADYQKNKDNYISWPCLGEDQQGKLGNMRTMDNSNLGIYIASPLLYLPEGERTISIKIKLESKSFEGIQAYFLSYKDTINANKYEYGKKEDEAEKGVKTVETIIYELLSSAFVITYTSTKGWESIKRYFVKFDPTPEGAETIEIILKLKTSDEPIDNYNQGIHNLNFDSKFPIIRIGLNNFSKHYAYSFLQDIVMERITIKSDVKGFCSLLLQNSIGLVSPTSPFQVFGPQPILGSFLDIKNTNVFNRYLKDFSINISWLNLPREYGGFETYYKEYPEPFKNNSFAVSIKALKTQNLYSNTKNQQQKELFTIKNNGFLSDFTVIDKIDFSKLDFINEPSLVTSDNNNPFAVDGTLRLELSSPKEAFGQDIFTKIFPEAVMSQAKKKSLKQALPNQPIIPIIKSIAIDYSLEYSEILDGAANRENCKIQLIHDYPFGYDYIYPNKYKKHTKFMPEFLDYDNLCIGLKDVEPKSELNLLFKFEDSSFHYTLQKTELIWSYLKNNSWIPFSDKDIIFDTTNDFMGSGIIRIFAPSAIPSGNTIMNPDLFWIKATTVDGVAVKPNLLGIAFNGVAATRKYLPENYTQESVSIPPYSIKGFEKTIKGVSALWQLFSSVNGEPPESTDKFYTRVSERLRHKQRPVQNRDIAQVVLENFPEIMMVKCFNTEIEGYEVVEGTNLHLVLIPKESRNNHPFKDVPRVSLLTLFDVKSFLDKIISPFITIEVGNPIYERVKVVCEVVLTDKAKEDSGNYLRKLTKEINNYIAPWLYDKYNDFKIGDHIYKSDLLLFIKTRPYIEYVTGFSLIHFYKERQLSDGALVSKIIDSALNDIKYIECSSPASVFVPSEFHILKVLEKPVHNTAKQLGIANFIVGEELLIEDGQDIKTQDDDSSYSDYNDEDELFNFIINHNI
jgi:hypothetical protein